jgi:IS5 family transposase
MFLKFRYRLGYESVCREVSDSITWRRLWRIRLEASVPHPTTLMKLTTRCGATAVAGLNETLLAKATQATLLRTTAVRADTTVVPSNVAYPTDSGLLAKAIGRIAATQRRIKAAGGATRTNVRNRSGAAGGAGDAIGAKLRSRSALGRDEALAAARGTTGELADLAETPCGRRRTAAGQRQVGSAPCTRPSRRAPGSGSERRGRRSPTWTPGPRERPGRPGSGDPSDLGPDPAAASRTDP